MSEYFAEPKFLEIIKEAGNYKRTMEKARSSIEVREYYQTSISIGYRLKETGKVLKQLAWWKPQLKKMVKKPQIGDFT